MPRVILIATGLIFSVASLTMNAQPVSRAIPRDFAGYRLGMPADSVAGWPHGCRNTKVLMEVYCLVGSSGPELLLVRDTVYAISSMYVILQDNVGATSGEVWRTYAGPRAVEMLGAPDLVQSVGDTITRAGWNQFGHRTFGVVVFRSGDHWAILQTLVCPWANHNISDIDFRACLRGDRP